MNGNGTLYFFTGLAGAGKSTIGGLFYEKLKEKKPDAVLFDGHVAREKVVATGAPRDYSLAARLAGARAAQKQMQNVTGKGIDAVWCSMSLFDEIRDLNRSSIANYVEIYLKVPMETLKKRREHLYSGEETQVVGLDLAWEEPKTPDIIIENDGRETPEAIVERLAKELGIG